LRTDVSRVNDETVATKDLLEQWREATRAADLAERLAKLAAESVERSDHGAAAAEDIARMAERAAKSSDRAAKFARQAAQRAAAFAAENRTGTLAPADDTLVLTRAQETAARERYHEAERTARER